MKYRLKEGISWCLCADRAVFLDMCGDRYFCLAQADDAVFRQWVEHPNGCGHPDRLERLVRFGVISSCDDSCPSTPAVTVESPTRDLAIEADGESGFIDLIRALTAQRWASVAIRRRSLQSIMEDLTFCSSEREETPIGNAQLRRLAAAFARSALLLKAYDNCLARALAMRSLFRGRSHRPSIVFGVRLAPFAAHCWVQYADAVLVGDLEQARLFTPIRVIP